MVAYGGLCVLRHVLPGKAADVVVSERIPQERSGGAGVSGAGSPYLSYWLLEKPADTRALDRQV